MRHIFTDSPQYAEMGHACLLEGYGHNSCTIPSILSRVEGLTTHGMYFGWGQVTGDDEALFICRGSLHTVPFLNGDTRFSIRTADARRSWSGVLFFELICCDWLTLLIMDTVCA